MAGSALSPAGDIQTVPAERESQQGAAEPSCSGEGAGRMVPSDYEVRQRMVRPQLCKCRQRTRRQNFSPVTSQPIDVTYRPLPRCSQKLSQELINISQGNLENLHTLCLQPGRGSPGYRFPGGLSGRGWEVEVRI